MCGEQGLLTVFIFKKILIYWVQLQYFVEFQAHGDQNIKDDPYPGTTQAEAPRDSSRRYPYSDTGFSSAKL